MSNISFANAFSPEELSQIHQAFSEGDTNGDGFLDYEEFSKVISPYVLVEEQLKNLFSKFDINGDNKIDLTEFTSALTTAVKGTPQQKLEALFRLYDGDHNNVLTPDEVNKVLTHVRNACEKIMGKFPDPEVTESFAKAVMSKLDLNKDGNITLEEWIAGGHYSAAIGSFGN